MPEDNPEPVKLKLSLNTLANCRKSLARVIRLYAARELDERTYKGLVYGLANLVSVYKTEKDIVIEERLKTIEEILRARGVTL